MSDAEQYFTTLQDGELAVRTVTQSGEIIPDETRPAEKYTTALVQTDNGPQLAVKTFSVGGGGGGGDGADKSLSNLTNSGYVNISHNAMPSDVYDTLTFPASGTMLTAPADGYFKAWTNSTGGVNHIAFVNTIDGETHEGGQSGSGEYNYIGAYDTIGVKKGDKVLFYHAKTHNLKNLRFYYAVGSESEKSN